MEIIKLTYDPLLVDDVTNQVSDASCGAISIFIGTTRDNFDGQKVVKLEYEAYEEMAKKEMKKLCTEVRNKFSVKHIAMYHRLGVVGLKEASVILAISSAHRRESLDAVSYLIDRLKAVVPIWKKEIFEDGTSIWKQNKECLWNQEAAKLDSCLLHEDSSSEAEGSFPYSDSTLGNSSPIEDLSQTDKLVDKDLIQIHASRKEIERRISAFQRRKREELNIMNIHEFCLQGFQDEGTCARTSAIFLRSKNSNSHLKFTKVKNHWGPQTDSTEKDESQDISVPNFGKKMKIEPLNDSESSIPPIDFFANEGFKPVIPLGIEERLLNMEEHLNINGPVPPSVYKRLKDLEDRILYLESLSPEYFFEKKAIDGPVQKEKNRLSEIKIEENKSDISLKDIDEQMFELKNKMKKKQMGLSDI